MYWKACNKVHTDGNIADIQRIPLSSPHFRRQVENFLAANGLRLESVDDYFCSVREDGSIAAGAGLSGDLVKCVAVDPSERSQGLLAPLISHLVSVASSNGVTNLKVFTKPSNEKIFLSLGFHVIACAPLAVLMENGRGLEDYLMSLSAARSGGSAGVIIMNANPFTLGHQHLVMKASESVDRLFVIPVQEDVSMFPYEERLAMIRSGCEGLATVLEGSAYQISAATFPTYFLKDLSEASETQMLLDLDLFGRHIAPALGVTKRFVGDEPTDPLTARYNELMKQVLPKYGVTVVEVPRLVLPAGTAAGLRPYSAAAKREWTRPCPDGSPAISASIVRDALEEGHSQMAAAMTPRTTWPYLVAELMSRALMMELDAPLKPGLVDPSGTGAHSDMDYSLMKGSVETIRRSFIHHLPILASRRSTAIEDDDSLSTFGKAIEGDVLEYTGGVNTYRGAIFALGLAAISALSIILPVTHFVDNERVAESDGTENGTICLRKLLKDSELYSSQISRLASGIEQGSESHGGKAVKEYDVKGALQMAREGYKPLFEDWLPFYRSLAPAGDAAGLRPYSAAAKREWTRPCPDGIPAETDWRLQKTLLRIMSSLDDTCVIHRVGYDRAQEVKEEAKALLEDFSEEGLRDMKARFDARGVSPGGAADMLALTIFMDSLIN